MEFFLINATEQSKNKLNVLIIKLKLKTTNFMNIC